MIGLIIAIAALFYWLMRETNWLKVNLYPTDLVAKSELPKFARYEVYHSLTTKKYYTGVIHSGGNLPEGYTPNGEPCYQIVIKPGIDNVLCGWEWLDKHCAAMVDYKPEVYLAMANVRYNMIIKAPAVIPDIMKANKMTRKERALAIA